LKFVNLTPHTINVMDSEGKGELLVVPPSGSIARVAVSYNRAPDVEGIPVYVAVYGDVEGVPAAKDDVFFIVSGLVESRIQRSDIFSPGDLVRNSEGRPVGCKGLKQS